MARQVKPSAGMSDMPLDAARWPRRGVLHRARDSALYLFNEVL